MEMYILYIKTQFMPISSVCFTEVMCCLLATILVGKITSNSQYSKLPCNKSAIFNLGLKLQ